jgi:hypothetical protein
MKSFYLFVTSYNAILSFLFRYRISNHPGQLCFSFYILLYIFDDISWLFLLYYFLSFLSADIEYQIRIIRFNEGFSIILFDVYLMIYLVCYVLYQYFIIYILFEINIYIITFCVFYRSGLNLLLVFLFTSRIE